MIIPGVHHICQVEIFIFQTGIPRMKLFWGLFGPKYVQIGNQRDTEKRGRRVKER